MKRVMEILEVMILIEKKSCEKNLGHKESISM